MFPIHNVLGNKNWFSIIRVNRATSVAKACSSLQNKIDNGILHFRSFQIWLTLRTWYLGTTKCEMEESIIHNAVLMMLELVCKAASHSSVDYVHPQIWKNVTVRFFTSWLFIFVFRKGSRNIFQISTSSSLCSFLDCFSLFSQLFMNSHLNLLFVSFYRAFISLMDLVLHMV